MTKLIKPLKLNLQFFAEETEPDNSTGDSVETPAIVELTDEELNKKIEAESDRKLAKALEKKQKEWDSQLNQKIADAKTEAESYAKLSAKEKEDAEYNKRIEALERRERELNNRQLTSEIESDLKEKNLPKSVSDLFVLLQDNEKIKERIGSFEKEVNEFVNERVKEALRQDTPKGSTGDVKGITKEQFNKMGYSERAQLFNDDPELYKQFSN